jgi:hypothetical protein
MLRTLAALAAAAVVGTLTVVPASAATHKPCAAEYQPLAASGCVWDGRHMGDKVGRSYFVHESGYVMYLPHRKAHRMLGR